MPWHMWSKCPVYGLQPYNNVHLPARIVRKCICLVFQTDWCVTIPLLLMHISFTLTVIIRSSITVFIGLVSANPCSPSPCGPNSQCRVVNEQPVCSCVPGFLGSPPTCRPECTLSSDCPRDLACSNQKCINPCTGSCGIRTQCQVINHNPICSCLPGNTGDPFVQCYPISKDHIINQSFCKNKNTIDLYIILSTSIIDSIFKDDI